jgi:hypothetical protein
MRDSKFNTLNVILPDPVTELSEAKNNFARLNTEIVDSNPTRGMVSATFYFVFVLSRVGSGIVTG